MEKGTGIKVLGSRVHTKASEKYIDVTFGYPNGSSWIGSVPIEYRRTGTFAKNKKEIWELLKKAYIFMTPSKKDNWIKEQEEFWKTRPNAYITKSFFDKLTDSKWKCLYCELPKNTNPTRRIQDIKEAGYTLATNTKMFCKDCNKNTTHLILVKLPRGHETGYEIWSSKLKNRIIKILGDKDVYENAIRKNTLPDHKFPEIRWDKDTKEDNAEDMSEEQIKNKFQLLDNQRNQQKREVCRNCFQTGKRGSPFGIKFFYKGGEDWDKKISPTGKEAEKGCIGCGWYDLKKWREELNKKLVRIFYFV